MCLKKSYQQSGKKWGKVVDCGKNLCNFTLKILCSMVTFIGEYNLKIDAKGRLVFPAALKRQIKTSAQDQFVIKEDLFEKCLVLFPLEEWERQNAILRKKLNPFNAKHNMFLRAFAKGAAEITLDSNNRLLLPKRLVDYAKIDKEIVLAGQNGKIELWAKENYQQLFDADIDYASLASEVLGNDLNSEV
jgi:MraZ protein